jgi:hypothetical protein
LKLSSWWIRRRGFFRERPVFGIFGGATRIPVPQLKTITPMLIPTTAMLILALTSCQDDNRTAGEKANDRPNQGVDQRTNQLENRDRADMKTDQRQDQLDQRGTPRQPTTTGGYAPDGSAAGTTGGTTTGGTTGGTTTGGTTTGGTTTGGTTGNTTDDKPGTTTDQDR